MIGRGPYSKVYKVNKKYAVKVCKRLDYFLNEMAVFSHTDHPNIMSYYRYDINNYYNILLPLADRDLYDHVMKGYPFDYTSFASQIALGLFYLEQNNILHCDLKPENILVFGNRLKICDFGVIEMEVNRFTLQINGATNEYKPPEELNFIKRGIQSVKDFKAVTWMYGQILLFMRNDIRDELINACLLIDREERISIKEICEKLNIEVGSFLAPKQKLVLKQENIKKKPVDKDILVNYIDKIYLSLALNIYCRTIIDNIYGCLYIAANFYMCDFNNKYKASAHIILEDLKYDIYRTTEMSYKMLEEDFCLSRFNRELIDNY